MLTQAQHTEKTTENAHEVNRGIGGLHRRRERTKFEKVINRAINVIDGIPTEGSRRTVVQAFLQKRIFAMLRNRM